MTGAQVAFACQNRHRYQLLPVTITPIFRLSAAFDIIGHITAFFNRQQPLTPHMLPHLCPEYPPSVLSSVLNHLLAAGLVHLDIQQHGLFPTIPAAEMDHGLVVRAILGTEVPDTEGGRHSQRALEAASRFIPPWSFQRGE